MKLKMSFISIIFALLIVFILYKLYFKPSKESAGVARTSIHKAKTAVLDTDLVSVRQAVSMFYNEKGRLPESLKELTPTYLRYIPIDPWGQEYRYEKGDNSYKIISAGKDKYFNTSDDIIKEFTE